MRRGLRAGLAALALGAALAACSGPPAQTYDLSALGGPAAGAARGRGQIVVVEPVASQALDSERIVVRPKPDQIAYLAGAQWADRLPKLVQARLIQTFENTRLLAHVGRPGDRLAADRTLDSELRNFEIDVEAGQAVVEISVKLVNERNGRIADAKIFRAVSPASSANGEAASRALDAALGEAMRAIVAWAAARV